MADMPHRLQTTISDALWTALQARAESLGQPIRQVVQDALADALDVAHHSMFQVSTSGALVEGLYQGAVTVGDLRRHGDTGLGTFEDLDGEMILIDGHCFQARSDGTVVEAPDDALTPFASVVNFAADSTADLAAIGSYAELTERLGERHLHDVGDALAARARALLQGVPDGGGDAGLQVHGHGEHGRAQRVDGQADWG